MTKVKRNPFSKVWIRYAITARKRLAWLERRLGERGLVGRIGSERRATALETCGRCSVALSPTTGAVLEGISDGRPGMRRRTCKHRLCPDCAGVRAAKVAGVLGPAVQQLLRTPTVSDGVLRMVTLTQQDEAGGSLRDAAEEMWRCWKKMRLIYKETGRTDLKTCFASLEITYNSETDAWHPHLHVILLAQDIVDRDLMLATWQTVHGYEVSTEKGSRGGVWINEAQSIKEAVKYPLKGLSETIEKLPESRALEMVGWLRSKRLLRTYGELRGLKVDEDEEADDVETTDGLLIDPSSLEVWAPSQEAIDKARRREGVGVSLDARHVIAPGVTGSALEIVEVTTRLEERTVWDPSWLDGVFVCAWSFAPGPVDEARGRLETLWAASPDSVEEPWQDESRVLDAPGE